MHTDRQTDRPTDRQTDRHECVSNGDVLRVSYLSLLKYLKNFVAFFEILIWFSEDHIYWGNP